MAENRAPHAAAVAFPVAATWFSALFGPSLLSGAYAAAYFLPYGSYAVVLPFVAFSLICVFAALGANIVRLKKAYDYAAFAHALYGRAYRFLMPFLDYDILMAMCLGGASCIATVSHIASTVFGINGVAAAIVFSLLALAVAVYGERAVRRFSSIMTVLMMCAFGIFVLLFLVIGKNELGAALSNWAPAAGYTLPGGIKGAILLGFSNFGMVGGALCAVEQNVTTAKECRYIGILSFIMNSLLMAAGALMLLPYCHGILGEATPAVAIMTSRVAQEFPFITWLYYLLMFMALISSAVPQLHAVSSRINRMLEDRHKKHGSGRRRTLYIGIVYFTVCILLSLLGLMTIVSKGYSFSAWLHLCVLAIPILLWYVRRGVNKRKAGETV